MACGVANLLTYRELVAHLPRFVTSRRSGAGFSEFARYFWTAALPDSPPAQQSSSLYNLPAVCVAVRGSRAGMSHSSRYRRFDAGTAGPLIFVFSVENGRAVSSRRCARRCTPCAPKARRLRTPARRRRHRQALCPGNPGHVCTTSVPAEGPCSRGNPSSGACAGMSPPF